MRMTTRQVTEAVREQRGIFEDEDPLPGLRGIRVVASDGRQAALILVRSGWVDDRFLSEVEHLLERKDPALVPGQMVLPLRLLR